MSDAQQQTQQKHRLYGRAAGKPLSKRQQALVDDLLPTLAIPEAGQGELFPDVRDTGRRRRAGPSHAPPRSSRI